MRTPAVCRHPAESSQFSLNASATYCFRPLLAKLPRRGIAGLSLQCRCGQVAFGQTGGEAGESPSAMQYLLPEDNEGLTKQLVCLSDGLCQGPCCAWRASACQTGAERLGNAPPQASLETASLEHRHNGAPGAWQGTCFGAAGG